MTKLLATVLLAATVLSCSKGSAIGPRARTDGSTECSGTLIGFDNPSNLYAIYDFEMRSGGGATMKATISGLRESPHSVSDGLIALAYPKTRADRELKLQLDEDAIAYLTFWGNQLDVMIHERDGKITTMTGVGSCVSK